MFRWVKQYLNVCETDETSRRVPRTIVTKSEAIFKSGLPLLSQMDQQAINFYRKVSLLFFFVIIGFLILAYGVTFLHQNSTSKNPFIFWTVKNHLSITVALIFLSAVLGYFPSAITYRHLKKTQKESRTLLDSVLLFLNQEERAIINHLVQQKGLSGQAEISRLPGMNRVKAYRSLKKMQEKNLLGIVPHGKVRKVALKENILQMLKEG